MATKNMWQSQKPAEVAFGGTGDVTLTANAVLLGNGVAAVASVGPGTNGQLLLGSTGAAPTWQTPTATAGGNLAVVSNNTTLSYGINAPVTFANGGTGRTTAPTAFAVICGPTGAGTALQNVVGVGTVNQVLTSAGAAALPTWNNLPASTITITGDAGGGITSNAFTFTGVGTPFTFVGAGTTFTLTWNALVPVAHGGTGAATLTANGVLLGNGVGAVTAAGPGTNGQVLLGTTGAAPTFVTPTATAGGNLAVVANATTHSYGINAPVTFANGGTGRTTAPTSYAVICGPTGAGTALQNVVGVGSATQVLTSNGAGALPSWQPAGGGGSYVYLGSKNMAGVPSVSFDNTYITTTYDNYVVFLNGGIAANVADWIYAFYSTNNGATYSNLLGGSISLGPSNLCYYMSGITNWMDYTGGGATFGTSGQYFLWGLTAGIISPGISGGATPQVFNNVGAYQTGGSLFYYGAIPSGTIINNIKFESFSLNNFAQGTIHLYGCK